MNTRRKICNLVSLEKRQIVLNSQVIKQYPAIERILQRYEKIYKSDFEDTGDFDKDTQTFFQYSFNELFQMALKEWYANNRMNEISKNKEEWPTCSLCNTKNKYIFYIVNNHNNKELNVGSECIEKFPSLYKKFNRRQIIELKNEKINEYKRIERISKINDTFPDIESILRQWKLDYEASPLILPYNTDEGIKRTIEKGFEVYNYYIQGKGGDTSLDRLEKIIAKHKEYEQRAKRFVKVNKNNNLACDFKLKKWIIDTNNFYLLQSIMSNNGFIDKNTVKYMYEESFIKKRINLIEEAIKGLPIKLKEFKDNKLFFSYKNRHERTDYIVKCDIKDFMLNFGEIFITPLSVIDFSLISTKFILDYTESNILSLFSKIDYVLKRSGFYIKHDFFNNNIEYYNNHKSMFATGSLKEFIELNTSLIFMNDSKAREVLLEILSSGINWRPIEDKSKYDIGNISRIPSFNNDR